MKGGALLLQLEIVKLILKGNALFRAGTGGADGTTKVILLEEEHPLLELLLGLEGFVVAGEVYFLELGLLALVAHLFFFETRLEQFVLLFVLAGAAGSDCFFLCIPLGLELNQLFAGFFDMPVQGLYLPVE